jgi:hypothetical protein
MNILTPLTITDAMILAGTSIAEPDASETAWVSAGTYTVGQERIRTTTHKVYECVQASSGRTALPEVDTAYWLEKRPTLRHAPFDIYKSTAATAATSLTYVLQPGYFNAISMYGLVGTTADITVKDETGGATIYSNTVSLLEDALGLVGVSIPPDKANRQADLDRHTDQAGCRNHNYVDRCDLCRGHDQRR